MARVRKNPQPEDDEQGSKSSHCVSLSSHISKFSIIFEFFFVIISFLGFDLCFFAFQSLHEGKGRGN